MLSISDEDNGGYAITPSWVCPAVLSAALGVEKALLCTNQEIAMEISQLGMQPQEV
jgi:hypothetical protein